MAGGCGGTTTYYLQLGSTALLYSSFMVRTFKPLGAESQEDFNAVRLSNI